MVDELRLWGSRRCRQMGRTLPTEGGWSNMAAILLRTTPLSQRAKPHAAVVGDAGWRNQLRVWSRRTAAQEPGLRRHQPRRLGPTHRELAADTRIQWRQWSARRLWKVPPLLETRSDCARVPITSHSPGAGWPGTMNLQRGFWLPFQSDPSTCCGSPAFRQPVGKSVGMSRSGTWPIRPGHWPDR